MSKLHLISQVSALASIKDNIARYANNNDQLVFIGDSVICLLDKEIKDYLEQLKLEVHALIDDCECRGISQQLSPKMKQISSNDMVKLTTNNQQVISW